jgi:hypothetical protein
LRLQVVARTWSASYPGLSTWIGRANFASLFLGPLVAWERQRLTSSNQMPVHRQVLSQKKSTKEMEEDEIHALTALSVAPK